MAAHEATSGPRVRAIVLAAGVASRFGGAKLTTRLQGRTILAHVIDRLAEAGIDDPIIVVGTGSHSASVDPGQTAQWVENAEPGRGISSSLKLGWQAALAWPEPPAAVLVLLGDQPRVNPGVIRAVANAPLDEARPIVAVRYAGDGAPNPVRIDATADDLVQSAAGDRGLGPILAAHPELVRWIEADGSNPDIDEREDLRLLLEADWAERVRDNAEQVARLRETSDEDDHYAPVTSLFRDDPRRSGDPVLDALLRIAKPGQTWLDVGAGAGRFALPLALAIREVIAVDPSAGMLDALREARAEHAIDNVRVIEGRWPAVARALGPMPIADHALIAQVGYDVEDIGPFLDALEAAASAGCVAVMRERSPAAAAEPFWPVVHGERRISLPALPDLLDLLAARGSEPSVEWIDHPSRSFASRDALLGFLRRQTWVRPGSEKDRRLEAELDRVLAQPGHALPDGSVRLAADATIRDAVVRWVRS